MEIGEGAMVGKNMNKIEEKMIFHWIPQGLHVISLQVQKVPLLPEFISIMIS